MAKQTKFNLVYETILRQIEQGHFAAGVRLPSIRSAAEDYGVSKNTIINVYDSLVALGVISAKQGSGFIVNSSKPRLNEVKPNHVKEASDIISLLHAQLEKDFSIRVGDGRPPASWTEDIIPKRLSASSTQNFNNDKSGYGSPFGHLGLREAIAAQHQIQNINVTPDQIVMTFGANHALDLIIRRLLSPGDVVLVDDPGYYPLFAKLKLSQIEFVGVKRSANGPDIEDLKAKAEKHKPALFFTQSLAQNPTGSSLDLPTAHSILQIASQHNFYIVDDDPFIDLPNVSGTRLAALDAFNKVIFVGSFSKVLSASFRSGYIIAHPELSADFAEFKMISCINSSRFSEIMIAELFNNRFYQKHLKKIARRTVENSKAVCSKLEAMGHELFCQPNNGFYIMLNLPENVSDLELAKLASQKGIFLAPGSLFSISDSNRSSLRINVTRADDSRFYNFLKQNV